MIACGFGLFDSCCFVLRVVWFCWWFGLLNVTSFNSVAISFGAQLRVLCVCT